MLLGDGFYIDGGSHFNLKVFPTDSGLLVFFLPVVTLLFIWNICTGLEIETF